MTEREWIEQHGGVVTVINKDFGPAGVKVVWPDGAESAVALQKDEEPSAAYPTLKRWRQEDIGVAA